MTDEAALAGQRELWALGDYPAVARHLQPISTEALEVVGVAPGERLLDVGVGDGNTAIEAARRGAAVTGLDLSPEQLALARKRAAAEGLAIALDEGNAEELPYPAQHVDVVVSVLAVIFASDPRRAAAELARACRPSGRVAVVSWARQGRWPEVWRERAERLVPEAGAAFRSDPWSDPASMAALLGEAGLDVEVETRPFHWSFPSVDAACAFFMQAASMFVALDRRLSEAGRPGVVAAEVRAAMEEADEAVGDGFRMESPYLLAVGRPRLGTVRRRGGGGGGGSGAGG